MPRLCELASWVPAPGQSTRVPSAASLRLFSASPETQRRLSPGLRSGILSGALAYKALHRTRDKAGAGELTR